VIERQAQQPADDEQRRLAQVDQRGDYQEAGA
jgi:hypothetical protein